jgi:hypothetical protein
MSKIVQQDNEMLRGRAQDLYPSGLLVVNLLTLSVGQLLLETTSQQVMLASAPNSTQLSWNK